MASPVNRPRQTLSFVHRLCPSAISRLSFRPRLITCDRPSAHRIAPGARRAAQKRIRRQEKGRDNGRRRTRTGHARRSARDNTDAAAVRFSSSHAKEESYDEFNAKYTTFFEQVGDLFELQRGLNNCFAYDLVPSTSVIEAALRASRKVNDYATAVRILEGVKAKVENKGQYEAYLNDLKPVIDELGELS